MSATQNILTTRPWCHVPVQGMVTMPASNVPTDEGHYWCRCPDIKEMYGPVSGKWTVGEVFRSFGGLLVSATARMTPVCVDAAGIEWGARVPENAQIG